MTQEDLTNILKEKTGYLKWGASKVAETFGVSRNIAKKALSAARKGTPVATPRLKFSASKGFENPLVEIARLLIQEDKIDEAIDLLKKEKKSKVIPTYTPSNYEDGEYIVLGCTHLPFHNKKLWASTCKLIKELPNLKGVILAGDILDMHSISRHSKGKIRLEGYTLGREYREANKELDKLDAAIGKRAIAKEYFYGNHEDWWNQWGKDIDNHQLGSAGSASPYDACFKHRGYKTQFNWKTAKVILGDLEIMHGEWCNKHAAHKHATELHRNVAFFHTHRMGTYFESTIAGYNCGWGGDSSKPVFNYMSRASKENWRNGILYVTLDKGIAFPQILDFKQDKLCFNGKMY